MHIIVIGGGWYGCQTAIELARRGIFVTLVDRQGDVLCASSKWNQNRLHQGFHYMRSYKTRSECRRQFQDFKAQYYTSVVDNNIYIISNNSLIDMGTVRSIAEHEHMLNSDDIIVHSQFNNSQAEFVCNERMIDVAKNRSLLRNQLDHFNIETLFNTRIHKAEVNKLSRTVDVNGRQFDGVVICTYNQDIPVGIDKCSVGVVYELCLILVYKRNDGAAGRCGALTVIDGPFSSLYPMEHEKYGHCFTLTDVKETPILIAETMRDIEEFKVTTNLIQHKQKHMSTNMSRYMPEFESDFKYIDYYTSVKCKIKNTQSDDRCSIIEAQHDGLVVHFFGGKITGALDNAVAVANHFLKLVD